MSKCKIRIVLERENAIYRPGETVIGVVHVSVDEAVECEGVTLSRFWKTHGRGNRDKGSVKEDILFVGKLTPGDHLFDFAFAVEDGPFSYHGEVLNIDWYVKAHVDIPWAGDPEFETEFIIERNTKVAHVDTVNSFEQGITLVSPIGLKRVIWLGALTCAFVSVNSYMLYSQWVSERSLKAFFGGILFFGIYAFFLFWVIKGPIAQFKTGIVKVGLSHRRMRPGQSGQVELSLKPRGRVMINRVSAILIGCERVESGSGSRRTTHSHTFYQESFDFPFSENISAGTRISERIQFQIPADAPLTFSATDNAIEWRIQMLIDIPNWPDWEVDELIEVVEGN